MTVAIVFPHQLFDPHPALEGAGRAVLVEDDLFFRDERYPARHHRLRLVLHRAQMTHYAARLGRRGLPTEHVAWAERRTLAELLAGLAARGATRVQACDVADFVLERRLRRAAREAGLALALLPSPGFLNTAEDNDAFFDGRRRWLMADFYRYQRRRLNLLLDADGEPLGGRWSFDEDNRQKITDAALRDAPPLPNVPQDEAIAEARAYVERHFPDHVGASGPLPYPVTHEAAARWLEAFVAERLDRFGPFEDALVPGQSALYHGVLTPLLNTGLLTPRQVLEAVLARADAAPLQSVEGFVRQVVGWREYMRAAYAIRGVELRTANVWGFERAVPEAFYTGETGLLPVDDVIRRVLRTGYANHIERLMVLGTALFLTRCHPAAVTTWFHELFVDAYDWVMVPNVAGMSQHAAGPVITTKPYVNGANYLRRMGRYARGPWEAEWDGLFWTFVRDHAGAIGRYHRIGMLARTAERMDPAKMAAHAAAAARYRARVGA
ncbi:MAG: cryptochrome/photolyase family protein [Rubricoccaceae bacterium]